MMLLSKSCQGRTFAGGRRCSDFPEDTGQEEVDDCQWSGPDQEVRRTHE